MTFVAAGTGITPCYAVLRAAVDGVPGQDESGGGQNDDATLLRLVYANRHEEDVLLKPELDALAARSRGRLQITYTLSRPNREAGTWKHRVGRIDEAMLRECAIAPTTTVPTTTTTAMSMTMEKKEGGTGQDGDGECLALMCGPHALLEDVCSPALERIGFTKANIITF